jgi:glycogen synthase
MIALHTPASAPAERLRVLMTTDAVGGVWRYSIDLSRALRDRGVHVTLALMGPAASVAQRREAARARVPVIDGPYRLEWMAGAEADVEEAGRWLLTLEQALRPDVIHLNGYAHAAIGWSVPVVVAAHSCVRSWWRAVKSTAAPPEWAGYSDAVRRALHSAAAVVAPSAAMLRALDDEYQTGVNGCVIPNGVGASQAARPPWHAKEPFVLSAGRAWDEAKNMRALVECATSIPWPIFLAGDLAGPGGERLDTGRVHALGALPAKDLRGWYRRAAIYALPARYEPFGLSVLEAARAGCALVLGDIPSLREHWDDTALFVPPDDPQAIAAAMTSLIETPALRQHLGRCAAMRSMFFSIDRTADAYVRLYEGVRV